uniref:Uncharacterized protein n=1 Tax=Ditylenchus dipsaci TaxID=166011 RepID=A0A915DS79_9BILA
MQINADGIPKNLFASKELGSNDARKPENGDGKKATGDSNLHGNNKTVHAKLGLETLVKKSLQEKAEYLMQFFGGVQLIRTMTTCGPMQ